MISKYLDVSGGVKSQLSIPEINALNETIEKSEFRELFNSKIEQLQKTFKSNDCLTASEAKKEIELIQASLKDNEYVGYIYQ